MIALTVATGAFAGGFVSGLAGFGTGLVALGIWLHVVPPTTAATLVAICSVLSQLQTLPTVWHAVDRDRVGPMVGFGLLGVPVGAWLLTYLNPDAFRIGTGILLLAYTAFMMLGRHRPSISWGGRPADGGIGFAGGILGGLAGLSGPLPTIWATLRGWGKDERRSVFQVFNLVILAATALAHLALGLVTAELLVFALIAAPGTIAGAWLGARAYRRLSNEQFHTVVLALLGLSGLTLVWSSL